ncbi:alkaline phosphatase family protein, partial [Arthrospira platensis SPKY1]|nr:alkaline phosphatase family protein [Arthrospira platensis SPKY1]
EIKDQLIQYIKKNHPDFIALNFANTDMVGHTGDFAAAQKAAEAVDQCLAEIVPLALAWDYHILIIADHGNSDYMINADGSPNTAHTTNPVPIIYVNQRKQILDKQL